MRRLLKNKLMKNNVKRIIAMILVLILTLTGVNLGPIMKANAATQYKTLYFIDNTAQQWVKNDSAVMELVDNTNGHDSYWMTQKDEVTWYVNVPESAYNITFNRYSSDKTVKWNSWSAGGRDENNAYYADGSEYGHWEVIEEGENYFHAGDIVYLDLTQFSAWKSSDAKIYINFCAASKKDNNGENVNIENSDKLIYNPKIVDIDVTENIYAYVIGDEEEGATELRFWRGNNTTLWNCSVVLNYDDYADGKNCIKVVEWDDRGNLDTYFSGRVYLNTLVDFGYISEEKKDELMDVDQDLLDIDDEYKYGTCPSNSDTDYDQIDDYSEIFVYGTDPTNIDSDGDGMSDGTEIQVGLNPNNVDSDGDGVIDSEEVILQKVKNKSFDDVASNLVKPEIAIMGKGDFSLQIFAEDISNNEMFGQEWIVGNAYNFVHDEEVEFEDSCLSFSIDESLLENVDADELCIAYYNENSNSLEFVESIYNYEKNTLSATVNHYSIYFIVDISKYIQTLMVNYTSDIVMKGKADIVFLIDTTGSMGNTISQVKNSIKTFADELEENEVDVRLGLVEYKDIYEDAKNSTKCYGWYDDVEQFRNQLSMLKATGGGDAPETVVDALNVMLLNLQFRNEVSKYAVVVTDATYKNGTVNDNNTTLNDIADELKKKDIATTVITKNNIAEDYSCLVYKTGGKVCNIDSNFSDSLKNIVTEIVEDIGDGCWIRLTNGEIIHLLKNPNDGDITVDSDYDGIPDLKELTVKSEIDFSFMPEKFRKRYNISNSIECWKFKSNPSKKDSDGDILEDKIDLEPLKYHPMEFGLEAHTLYYLELFNRNLRENKEIINPNYEFSRCLASISYGNSIGNLAMWSIVAGLFDNIYVQPCLINNGLNSNMASVVYTEISNEHLEACEKNKVDFSHMMATISCNLYEGKYKDIGALGGVSPALHGSIEDYSGYYGDVFGTLLTPPCLNNDDYMADLDSVNILSSLEDKNLLDECSKYYASIKNGKINRAYYFTKNIGDGDYNNGIVTLISEANIYAKNVKYNSEEVNESAIHTVGNFILNLMMQNNELLYYYGE